MKREQKARYTRPTSREVEEFKSSLGPIAAQYDNVQLARLRWEMYEMAEILLDIYLEKEQAKRNVDVGDL